MGVVELRHGLSTGRRKGRWVVVLLRLFLGLVLGVVGALAGVGPAHAADTEAPVFGPTPNRTFFTVSSRVFVGYQVSADDAVDGNVRPQCTPSSGAFFDVGVTTVSCTATDRSGNTATASFTVSVVRLRVSVSPYSQTAAVDQTFAPAIVSMTRDDGGPTSSLAGLDLSLGLRGVELAFSSGRDDADVTLDENGQAQVPDVRSGTRAGTGALELTLSTRSAFPISVASFRVRPGPAVRIGVVYPATLPAGEDTAIGVFGFDQYDNQGATIDPPTLGIGPNGTCADGKCQADELGPHTITARSGSFTTTYDLNVVPGPAASVQLSPGATAVGAGQAKTYSVRAYDRFGHAGDDVTGSSTLSIGPDGSCSGASCTATTAGPHTVTATFDGRLTDSATLNVFPGAAASIKVAPTSASIAAGGSQSYSVRAYDQYGNAGADVTGSSTLSIDPDGSCAGASCTATTAGAHTVTARYGSFSDTAALTVVPAAAASIKVTPASASVVAGGSQSYAVRAYDQYGNAGDDVTATSTLSISPDGSCSAASCTATIAGPHTVTARFGSLSATGTLNVTPGAAASIKVTPASASITAGGSQGYSVRAYDQYGNAGADVTGSSTLTISPDGSCSGASCTATVAGPHTVTARFGSFTATAALTVTPGAAAQVTATAGNAQQEAVRTPFSTRLGATVTDAYGNPVPGATVTFTVASGPAAFSGSSTATAVSTASGLATAPTLTAGNTTGSVTITASTGSASPATFLATVIPASSARADLRVAVTGPATLTRNGTATVTLQVTNSGPHAANTVTTGLVLGAGLSVTNGGGGTVRGSSVIYTLSSLAAGASQTYTVTVRVSSLAPRTVTLAGATVSLTRDPTYANNASTITARVS